MQSDLIFDIGCNNGDDTDFYLRKGFRVVAVDADQACCSAVASRFGREIEEGRCEVVYGAVGLRTGETVRFHLCDELSDWNTCDPYFVARSEKQGYRYRQVDVSTINVADLMDKWGTPYYLKIDIEGADAIPLRCIEGRGDIPTYVSIEIAQHDLLEGMEQIKLLDRLGYKRFNFFNQGLRAKIKAPRPALEGALRGVRRDCRRHRAVWKGAWRPLA